MKRDNFFSLKETGGRYEGSSFLLALRPLYIQTYCIYQQLDSYIYRRVYIGKSEYQQMPFEGQNMNRETDEKMKEKR
jgi:hypothetical protein